MFYFYIQFGFGLWVVYCKHIIVDVPSYLFLK